jgi:hypothetical protein
MTAIEISFKVFDRELARDRCGSCNRVLVTGQHDCVCGVTFDATLEVEVGPAAPPTDDA